MAISLPEWTMRQWAACGLVSLACGVGLVVWVQTHRTLPLGGFIAGAVMTWFILSVWMLLADVAERVVGGGGE